VFSIRVFRVLERGFGFKRIEGLPFMYMTNDVDFDATVDEVKDQIRDLEDPDFEKLLQQEKDDKDRKTIKEFIESRMDSEDVEESDESVEDEEESESVDEEVEQDLVEEIEEETSGGLLGGLSPEAVLVSGMVGGLVLGLLLGVVFDVSGANAEISPQQAEDRVESIVELQFDDYEFTSTPEMRSGMYYVSANITQEVQPQGSNETQEQEFPQNFYLTTDGEYLFPEQQQFGQVVSPIDVDQEVERAQQQSEQGQ